MSSARDLISAIPWVRHGITRRVRGLGLADGNVGYTAPRDEADAWEMRQRWARAIGIDPSDLVRVRQVHGTRFVSQPGMTPTRDASRRRRGTDRRAISRQSQTSPL